MTVPIANAAASEEALVKQLVTNGAALPMRRIQKAHDRHVHRLRRRLRRSRQRISGLPERDLYQDFPQPADADIIRYTQAAQKWMVERMYRDLQTIPVVRERLRDWQGGGRTLAVTLLDSRYRGSGRGRSLALNAGR